MEQSNLEPKLFCVVVDDQENFFARVTVFFLLYSTVLHWKRWTCCELIFYQKNSQVKKFYDYYHDPVKFGTIHRILF